ncbi:uncharacterized protein LOC125594385 [Brassica napus]|uniref:uncharacterized protein LOC106350642 n=1 Tax=Brassica napus TaxID=3708 RepID=UPI0020790589|nr:uncharacterized protein LOC106350642 [Brassica napus]XP_048626605.1 uncharacterized protein LOC125594385 [Brassica napus]
MQPVWNVPGRTSGVNPSAFAPGEPPPGLPPDPPDPSSPLSPVEFPSLTDSTSKTALAGASRKGHRKMLMNPTITAASTENLLPSTTSTGAIAMETELGNPTLSSSVTVTENRSETATVKTLPTETTLQQHYQILPSKPSSPTQTNKAASSIQTNTVSNQSETQPPAPLLINQTLPPSSTPPVTENSLNPTQTLIEKLRASADKPLKRLAPVAVSPTGRPRVVIPDAVFKKGADIHKDFIICYFNGKSPPFNQIQSVFNYMWGKGKRLEIHNNPLNRSVIVRIQSDYLRQKILEKNIWYVGDSMLHTAQWNSTHSMSTPPLKAIQIWAHITGVPLDLRHDEGLSLVAGLVGEPKDTDEFTRNLVSLTVCHVKVEVDLTVPLPKVVEFERESGVVVELSVHYPWVPPTCSHCHELGHIIRNCLTFFPAPPDKDTAPSNEQTATQKTKEFPQTPRSKPSQKTPQNTQNTTQNTKNPNSSFTPSKASRKLHKKYLPVVKDLPLGSVALTPVDLPLPSLQTPSSSTSLAPTLPILPSNSLSRQCITCVLSIPNQAPIYYTAIYASNQSDERVELWNELLITHSTLDLENKNWVVGGDLNQILFPFEHSNPDVNFTDNPMYQLLDCLLQAGLFDLRYLGPCHTWTNNQPESPTAKKLDRLLVNNITIDSYPHAVASFLAQEMSDHTPCLLNLALFLPRAGTFPDKFQNYLTKHPGFAQVQALNDPSPDTFQSERELHQKWNFLREIEELFFRQKSRINWLKEGDLNTAYFFRICQVRASYNAIRAFLTPAGAWLTDPFEMSSLAVSHFCSVLGPSFVNPVAPSTPEWFQSLLDFSISHVQASQMLRIPTGDEIRSMIFKLNPNKAPGPDGLTSGFFKAAWSTIGDEVITSITHFFYTGFLPSSANATILTLVPKFPGASEITEFRPISCLNTVYKVISRLLVKRLKPILPKLILPSQTAFVKGRLLLENTILASELINGYHKNKGSKKITIKVDIAKAFDTLSWNFLFSCLQGLGIPHQMLHWLHSCICTTSFMVGYNGTVNGYFKGTRGLRQGDPLSPYLFVIAMNCLSHMLNAAATNSKLRYHSNCKKVKLTHLSFADDLLIFIEGNIESVQCVLQVLKEFENRSGLAVSLQKTSFFASGMTEEEINTIQASTGMACGSLPFRYLGVPMNSRKLSLASCEPLLHQIKTRFSSWSTKTLSFSGRLMLIKTVIAGITTFWCSSFVLPKACVVKINSMCSAFLWKGNLDAHSTARVAWTTVCKPKEEGGLGVKDLLTWNKACCLRLIWLLFFRPDSVWVSWFKEVILKGSVSNYWTTNPSQKFSWLANKLLKLRSVAYPLIHIQIQNGEHGRFWIDNWSPFGKLQDYMEGGRSRLGIPLKATLASLYRNGTWQLPAARTENQLQVLTFITTINFNSQPDQYVWKINGKSSEKFSTGEVYQYLRGDVEEVNWAKVIWSPRSIPRQSFHAWLVVQNRIPTRDRLISWGLQMWDRTTKKLGQLPQSDVIALTGGFDYAITDSPWVAGMLLLDLE